jgi:hypothetical protein
MDCLRAGLARIGPAVAPVCRASAEGVGEQEMLAAADVAAPFSGHLFEAGEQKIARSRRGRTAVCRDLVEGAGEQKRVGRRRGGGPVLPGVWLRGAGEQKAVGSRANGAWACDCVGMRLRGHAIAWACDCVGVRLRGRATALVRRTPRTGCGDA